jgi:cyclopropane fatty-acyl-phospholipid synthase-like methyltransferase
MLEPKPFSQACENNKHPILEHLKRLLPSAKSVLEIGSGTGQHAVHFAHALPHIQWQTSDRLINHQGINAWINDQNLSNLKRPIELDVLLNPWPSTPFDAAYSANTAHIMPWPAVEAMFYGIAKSLVMNGRFILYGPFNAGGQFTSDSNATFDAFLRENCSEQGIRNIEDISALADQAGMPLNENHKLPANNQLLVFTRNR